MEGIYHIRFIGQAYDEYDGYGVLEVRRDGEIRGGDVAGVKYEGKWCYLDDGAHIDFSMWMKVPPGVHLVTGAPPEGRETEALMLHKQLPKDFGNGTPVLIETPTGTVRVVFHKILDTDAGE